MKRVRVRGATPRWRSRWVAGLGCVALSVATVTAVGAQAATLSATGITLSATPPATPNIYIADFSTMNEVAELPAGGGPETTVGSGLKDPAGVATDAAGDVFIGDTGNNRVLKVPAAGGPTTSVGTGLSGPEGVAVDPAGDVYIADFNNNRVVKVPAGGGPQTTVGTGLISPEGVAVDPAGDVFIADTGNNRLVKEPAGGGAQITVVSDILGPSGVAVDASGNLFIAETFNNEVVERHAGTGTITPIGSGFSMPAGVAVDAAGDVFVSDFGNSRVVEDPAGGGAQTTLATDISGPYQIALGVPPTRGTADTSLSFQATLLTSPSGGTPTGSVVFADGTSTVGHATLSGTTPDTATLSISTLAAGTHHLTATYGGGGNFAASAASAPVTVILVAPKPAVTSISPTSGPAAGGTLVTVTGTGFTGATKVVFGVVAGTDLTVVSDSKITVVSPAQAADRHNVFVTTPAGTSPTVPADGFTYS